MSGCGVKNKERGSRKILPSPETCPFGITWIKNNCFEEGKFASLCHLLYSQSCSAWMETNSPDTISTGDGCALPGRNNAPVLDEERFHNASELLFTDSLPPVSPFPVECRSYQVSCSPPHLSVSWFETPQMSISSWELTHHGLRPSALVEDELKLGQFRQEISDIFPAVNSNESLEESALGSVSSSLPSVF